MAAADGDVFATVDLNTMSVVSNPIRPAFLLGILVDDGTGVFIPGRIPFNAYTDDYDPPPDPDEVLTG